MYTVVRLDTEDQAAPVAAVAVVRLKILSEREPIALVTFILKHPAGRSYPVVTSEVELGPSERESVLRWLGGRIDLDLDDATFKVGATG